MSLLHHILFTFSHKAHAQEFDALYTTLSKYYKDFFVPIGLVLAGVMVVIGGIMYATSGGDPGKVTAAKDFIISTLIGVVVLLSIGWIIAQIVGNTV